MLQVAPTVFRILDAQFTELKFIKTNKFKSDLNFEFKMALAAIDLIISKKGMYIDLK